MTMAGKINLPEVPWWEDLEESDFRQWVEENPEDFREYIQAKKNQYETIRRGLRHQEPHPMHYELGVDDLRYQSDLRIWEHTIAGDVLHRVHNPPQQSQPLSRDAKVFLHGNERDKTEFRERMSLAKVAREQRMAEEDYKAMGNFQKGREAADRAASFERELKKREKGYQFSFEAEEKKQDLEFGKATAEEMMTWTPEQVRENLPVVENILQGWRDMSNEEYSFLVDTGSPYKDGGAEGSFRIVKIFHPGVPANELQARTGQSTAQGLLDLAHRSGFGIERHEEPAPETSEGETEGGEFSQEKFEESLKPL